MPFSSQTGTEPDRRVDWREVLGGVLLALVTGIFVVFGSFLAGLFVVNETRVRPLAASVAFLLPAVIYGPAYLLLRRRMPDLCRGLLIGGCVVTTIGGGCNALIFAQF